MAARLLALLLVATATAANSGTPDSCLEQPGLEKLIKCWRSFIGKEGSISDGDWRSNLPTEQQRGDWMQLIGQILSSDGTCQGIQIPQSIGDFYRIKAFEDETLNASFCVLFEKSVTGERYVKGWGILVVPAKQKWSRINLHYSVAHPFTDGPVELQAAAIFLRTNGRSLLITGATRNASLADSDCQRGYFRTDAAHDNVSMFHSALIAIKKWQFQSTNAKSCKFSNCAFLQFHGKADSTCVNDTIFLSSGYRGDAEIYVDPALPVNRLRAAWLRNAPPDWTASTPVDSKCSLSGTTNIFGRLLNGVEPGRECYEAASPTTGLGFFIHIEQATIARETGAYDIWAKSILTAFKPSWRG